jgi:CxxC motif-containing protein (DUF1111 family)
MTFRRAASAGISTLAVAAVVLLSFGNGAPPQFGDPLPGLPRELLARFQAGKKAFETAIDIPGGLGPVFNDTSCVNCHDQAATGGGSDRLETRFGLVTNGVFNPLTALGGQLIQERGIGGPFQPGNVFFVGEVVPPQANVQAQRRTTPLFGLGLVDAVPDATLQALAQFEQTNTPDTAGRVNVVLDVPTGQQRVGRFGWKCQIATLLDFNGNAFNNEMGVTTPFFSVENSPQGDTALLVANPARTSPNQLDNNMVEAFTDFNTMLAPPPQLALTRGARDGRNLFAAVGCADCHVPALQTGPNTVAALNGVVFFPYSDFLLHDMGPLADGISQCGATGLEMRTAPLWGARVRTSFLHDGRAETVLDAILEHNGQGLAARNRFAELSTRDQARIVEFINSL